MHQTTALEPIWDFLLLHLGYSGISSPAFLLTAIVAGIYVPGIIFSFVDVVITRRLTLRECWAVYWRAMKWYSTFYIGALVFFIVFPVPLLADVPAQAPTLSEFFLDLVLYFLLGDFVSYVWHRIEHAQGRYMKHVHYYHHLDKPPLTIWTAMVVHPVEGFSVFVCFHIYGILFPIHPLTFAIAAFSVTAVTMITHCGYRLPVYDWIFATAPAHHVHHSSREPKNISVVLSICDRLFGTYQKVEAN
jgi:sterol desaturase/sphingolipid hydroxylase (fatty acid hydroxylase superfamily)